MLVVVLLRGNDHQVTLPEQHRPDRDDRAVLAGEALQDLAAAVTKGADSEDSDLVDQVATNARLLRLKDVSLRYVDEDAGALAAGSDEWVAAVETTWAFRGFDRTDAETEVSFTFRRDGDGADIVAIGGHDRRTPLWLSGPVTVRRTPRTLVIVAGQGDNAEAGRYAGLARTAVTAVNRVLPDWHRGLVVEVAESADALVAELDAKPDEYAQIAAVTTTVDGSTEAGTDAANATMPLWLVEGFADYVALRDVRLPLSVTAAQITEQVRRHGVPDHLPTDEEFGTTQTHLGAQYEAAWLACRTLADLGSEAELRRIFGISQRSFVRTWQGRLQDLAG